MYYAYILRSERDGSYYTGFARDLKSRLREHNAQQSKYSSTKAPFLLIWYCAFPSKVQAVAFERYLKSGSGFAFARKRLVS